MADIKDVINVALEQLEKKKEELKKELSEQRDLAQALASLESRAQEIRQQLEVLANLPVPADLLDFYVKSAGRVWVSKLRGFEEGDLFRIDHKSKTLNSRSYGGASLEGLPTGAYRFILLMIPQEVPKGIDKRHGNEWQDDYGDFFQIPKGM